MISRLWVATASALLFGCSSSSAMFKEAEALEAQGKLEEAAAKFELVCAREPTSAECAGADARESAAWSKAADKALAEGQYRKAERLLRHALSVADEALAKDIDGRLSKDDLTQGLLYERALADADKPRALKTMKAVSATSAPAAAKAKEWLERERPTFLVQEVKEACTPEPRGSCQETWQALSALPQKPAGFEEAKAAFEAEEKRIYPTRSEAERFLGVFAQRGQKKKAYEKCVEDKAVEIPQEYQRTRQCRDETWAKASYERFDQETNDENLFRRRLKVIADPVIVASFEARKAEALDTGSYTKIELKKPAGQGK